jgi:hypothetical protein
MKRAPLARAAAAAVVLLTAAIAYRALRPRSHPVAAPPPAIATAPSGVPTHPGPESGEGFLYGRIAAVDGATYEGRLRWGGNQEAFWGDFFNGFKHGNPWAAQVPPARLPMERRPIEIFGITIAHRVRPLDLGRPLLARFGDIARMAAHGKEVRVTLKSGAAFDVDRFEASDFDDGVRVWDARRGVVDLDSLRIQTIELLPTPAAGAAPYLPYRLQGTARTRHGDFTGFVQWDREEGVGTDELHSYGGGGELRLRFDTLRTIARLSRNSVRVTRLDGREVVLSGTRNVGQDNRGLYVDDRRYGRVLVSWDAFERLDLGVLNQGGSGPAYGDYPPGLPLAGSVTTRAGRRLAGRLVFDLDESETIETLDAPAQGVDYTIPFGLVASIVLPEGGERPTWRATVTLQSGEELQLERSGDLGPGNAGLLVFVAGQPRPEYVPWSEVQRIDLDRPPAMFPPLAGR